MKNTKVYVDFITEKLKKLLSIDSPTGYTKDAIAWLKAEYEAMGYAPVITTKGGLLVQLAKGCEGNGGWRRRSASCFTLRSRLQRASVRLH